MKRAILSSYAAQGYLGLIGLAMMPAYLRYMGTEALGLIGILLMLQAWVQLFDLGLTPTFSREIARFRAGSLSPESAWRLVKSLEALFGGVALLIVLAFAAGRDWLAQHWLSAATLPRSEIAACLVAMAFATTLRWLTGLYRAGLVGLERQVWSNGAAIMLATVRYAGVVPVLAFVSPSPLVFFGFQALAGLLEALVFRGALRRALPLQGRDAAFEAASLRAIVPMAGAMALAGVLWIFTTQIDKLILSRLLPLEAYGHFTLAVMVAGSLLMFIPPLSQVLQPRLTILVAQGRDAELRELYSVATQCVTALFGALGLTMALFAEPLLRAWTGDPQAAAAAAPVLFWYGLANGTVGVMALPFALQYAHGAVRMLIAGSLASAIVLVPALWVMSSRSGAIGAGEVCLALNLLYLVAWVPVAHRKLGAHAPSGWLLRDVAPVAAAVVLFALAAAQLAPQPGNRWLGALVVALAFGGTVFCGLMAGPRSRATTLTAAASLL